MAQTYYIKCLIKYDNLDESVLKMIKYYMILQKIYTTNTVYKQQILEFLPTKDSLNPTIYINNKENEKNIPA